MSDPSSVSATGSRLLNEVEDHSGGTTHASSNNDGVMNGMTVENVIQVVLYTLLTQLVLAGFLCAALSALKFFREKRKPVTQQSDGAAKQIEEENEGAETHADKKQSTPTKDETNGKDEERRSLIQHLSIFNARCSF